MADKKWGTKRTCPKCSTRFYDLGKEDPVTCIECGEEWVPEPVLKSKQPIPEAKEAPKKEAPKKKPSDDDDDSDDDLLLDDDDDDLDIDLDDDDDIDVTIESDDDDDDVAVVIDKKVVTDDDV